MHEVGIFVAPAGEILVVTTEGDNQRHGAAPERFVILLIPRFGFADDALAFAGGFRDGPRPAMRAALYTTEFTAKDAKGEKGRSASFPGYSSSRPSRFIFRP